MGNILCHNNPRVRTGFIFEKITHSGSIIRIGHEGNFVKLSGLTVDQANVLLRTKTTVPLTVYYLNLGTYAGITGKTCSSLPSTSQFFFFFFLKGWIMVGCIIIMYTCVFFRRKNFEVFWYSHQLHIIFLAAVLCHGQGELFYQTVAWEILILPITVYILERIRRFLNTGYDTLLITGQKKDDGVVMIRVTKPKGLSYQAGQYIFLKCPAVSKFEWHPFTVTKSFSFFLMNSFFFFSS